jgi:hypothetical protein
VGRSARRVGPSSSPIVEEEKLEAAANELVGEAWREQPVAVKSAARPRALIVDRTGAARLECRTSPVGEHDSAVAPPESRSGKANAVLASEVDRLSRNLDVAEFHPRRQRRAAAAERQNGKQDQCRAANAWFSGRRTASLEPIISPSPTASQTR